MPVAMSGRYLLLEFRQCVLAYHTETNYKVSDEFTDFIVNPKSV